jgi:hypothetical protein
MSLPPPMSTAAGKGRSTLAPALRRVVAKASRRKSGDTGDPMRGPEPALPPDAKLPHERDESIGMTGGITSKTMQQAYRDLDRGLQDTDRGVEAGRTYKKLKR